MTDTTSLRREALKMPPRYNLAGYDAGLKADHLGHLVQWDDYRALRMELIRVTAERDAERAVADKLETKARQLTTLDDATVALSRIKREAEDAGIKIGLLAGAKVDWSFGKEVADEAPDYLSDWQRGLVAGQTVFRETILALTTDEARKMGGEE